MALPVPPERRRHIVVDSRMRNPSAHPRPSSYSVRLDEELRNVLSLELVYAVYHTVGTERYVHVFLEEARDRGGVAGLAGGVGGAFTQLPMVDPVNEYTPARHYRSHVAFRAPLARLPSLTLRFTDAFGRPADMGEHMMRFEAVCEESQGGPRPVGPRGAGGRADPGGPTGLDAGGAGAPLPDPRPPVARTGEGPPGKSPDALRREGRALSMLTTSLSALSRGEGRAGVDGGKGARRARRGQPVPR